MQEWPVPKEATLVTWSRVWIPVEGIDPPYDVGLVHVSGLRIFGHVLGIGDGTRTPTSVTVRVDSGHRLPYWFEVSS